MLLAVLLASLTSVCTPEGEEMNTPQLVHNVSSAEHTHLLLGTAVSSARAIVRILRRIPCMVVKEPEKASE